MNNFKHKQMNNNIIEIKTTCSISPMLSSLQSVILLCLEKLAFYLIKLDSFGICNEKINKEFIEYFSLLTANFEYSEENTQKVVASLYDYIAQAKELYIKACEEKNIKPEFFKSPIKISANFDITNLIRKGQKYAKKRLERLCDEKIKMLELFLFVLKSICIYLVDIQIFNVDVEEYYKEVLRSISIFDTKEHTEEQIIELIKKYVKLDNEVMKKLYDVKKNEYGNIMKTRVSTDLHPGKAILVAGSNIKELELVLQATQDKGINIYTHGQMIEAHEFSKFKDYPHLVGHYGQGVVNYKFDFERFPGPILLTKLSLLNVEKLYMSKIFTTDKLTSKGVSIIEENDFEPLIKSAFMSDGFEEHVKNEASEIGFSEEDLIIKLKVIKEKIKKGEIKNIIGMGTTIPLTEQTNYFKELLKILPKDVFVISFSNQSENENILVINVEQGFAIRNEVLNILAPDNNYSNLNFTMLYARCAPHSIANIFHMKYSGAKNIYLKDCTPSLINPSLVSFLREMIGVKEYTTPQEDLREILGQDV